MSPSIAAGEAVTAQDVVDGKPDPAGYVLAGATFVVSDLVGVVELLASA